MLFKISLYKEKHHEKTIENFKKGVFLGFFREEGFADSHAF